MAAVHSVACVIKSGDIVWVQLRGLPKGILWPVLVVSVDSMKIKIYCKSDNAELLVPIHNIETGIDTTKMLKLANEKYRSKKATLNAFMEDLSWSELRYRNQIKMRT